MQLFTKKDCDKCRWLKLKCDLSQVEVYELDDNPESWGLLAWNEGVSLAEKGLPILSLGHGKNINEINEIARELGVYEEYSVECEEGCEL